MSAIKDLEVEEKDIQTTNYSIYPISDFDAGQRITGFTVSTNISVKAPIEKVNEVIDAATQNGANNIGGVQFTFSDEMRSKLEDEARKEAVEEAKEKANKLANASGIRLGKIINVSESGGFEVKPMPLLQRVGGPMQDEQTNIEPGQSTVQISVTLTYETL